MGFANSTVFFNYNPV